MIKLDNGSSAWFNYFIHVQARFTNLGLMITPETMSQWMQEYNGLVIDHADNQGWQPYFKTEEDLSFFLLKWS